MAKLRGMNERIQKLRQISVTTPVHIDLERAKIETDFYRENDGKYSIPVMRAMTLKEYFSKKKCMQKLCLFLWNCLYLFWAQAFFRHTNIFTTRSQ